MLTSALRSASELPWGMHAVVALLMAAGMVLWLAGERVLKPAVVVFAGVLGALSGALIVATTPLSASATVWHGLGAGLFAGLLVGLLMYRSAIALGTGVVFGLLLPLSAACILSAINPDAKAALLHPAGPSLEREMSGATRDAHVDAASSAAPDDTLAAVLDRLKQSPALSSITASGLGPMLAALAPGVPKVTTDADAPESPVTLPENVRPALDRVHRFASEALGQASDVYLALPTSHRILIALSAVVGLAGGVIMGLSLPAWATGAVSSLFGAALWVPSLVWLSMALSAPWATALDRPALHWLIAWVALGLIGMMVQWSGVLGGTKRPKKPAAAPAPKPA